MYSQYLQTTFSLHLLTAAQIEKQMVMFLKKSGFPRRSAIAVLTAIILCIFVCCCLEMFDPPSKEPYSIPEYAFTKAL
jgi:hypothetical protein